MMKMPIFKFEFEIASQEDSEYVMDLLESKNVDFKLECLRDFAYPGAYKPMLSFYVSDTGEIIEEISIPTVDIMMGDSVAADLAYRANYMMPN